MSRYVQHSESDRRRMLERLGIGRVEDLWKDLPADRLLTSPLGLPEALSEQGVTALMTARAAENADPARWLSFLGAGAYDHYIPAVVPWVTSRPEFATAYTPYQAEVSQGTLEAIYEYQSLICELTGMDVANASVYDGATAVAEAALMAIRISRRKKVAVSGALHPHYRAVLETYARGGQMEVLTLPVREGGTAPESVAAVGDAACVIVQNPNFFGILEPLADLVEATQKTGALSVVSVDPVSLSLVAPPGEAGADIAVGEGQALGSPMAFGGPLLGFFACRQPFLRQMPGRVVGRTEDAEGRTAYVLTLQTREQHIRREKATSNICSNEALVALAATTYLAALGRSGFERLGHLCLEKSHYAARAITSSPGFSLRFPGPFFKEFVLRAPGRAEDLAARVREDRILAGVPLGPFDPALDDCMLVAVTEKRTRAEIDRWVDALARRARG
jgi:glycine dehydrogenase subunit 1